VVGALRSSRTQYRVATVEEEVTTNTAMNINKLLHVPYMRGQSLEDRYLAIKYTLTRNELAKSVCKATTEEQKPPKKKHIDC
jgi:hypothetical protein